MKKNKKAGFILSAELVMIASILVIGLLVGLVTIRNQMIAELKDTADSIGSLNQSFMFTGTQQAMAQTTAETQGTQFNDAEDPAFGDDVPPTVLVPANTPNPGNEGVGN